jgi:transcription elongation factor GreA
MTHYFEAKVGSFWKICKQSANFCVILRHQTNYNDDMSYEYMSQEGYDKLVEELRHMELVELPQVREAIAEARAQGDLSENFEYHAAKREQGRLLGRIRFKQRVLENARVIDTSARQASGAVQLLSKVEITNLGNNSRMTYTIASPHEANLREGKISIKSPIAQALLNKKAGDTIEVRVPAGLLKLRIESVS